MTITIAEGFSTDIHLFKRVFEIYAGHVQENGRNPVRSKIGALRWGQVVSILRAIRLIRFNEPCRIKHVVNDVNIVLRFLVG
jgi:hypothetical protein